MAVAEAWLAMQALCGVQACYKAHHPHAAARQTPNDNHAPARTHSLTHVGITLAGVFQQAGGPNAVLCPGAHQRPYSEADPPGVPDARPAAPPRSEEVRAL
jgi:hypothetical protein